MATQTTNYGLTKPSYGDNADISVINSNMDKIDAKMKEIEDAGGGGGGSSVEWKQITKSGTKIAEVTIDGNKTDVYAPNSSGGGSSSHNYSTEEQIVGTWIDGKPIYEKTIEFLFPGSGFNQIIYEFTDLDKCISLNGFCQTNSYTYLNISCFAGYLAGGENNYEYTTLLIANKKLCLSASNPFNEHSGKPCYCTIQYTKTTD